MNPGNEASVPWQIYNSLSSRGETRQNPFLSTEIGSIVSILSKVPPRKCHSHSSPLLPSPLLLLFTPLPPPPTFSFLLPSLPSYLTPSPSLLPSPFLLHHFCRPLLLSLPFSFPSLPSCLTTSPSILSVSFYSPPQAQWR